MVNLQVKREAVRMYEQTNNINKTASYFGIAAKSIKRWREVGWVRK